MAEEKRDRSFFIGIDDSIQASDRSDNCPQSDVTRLLNSMQDKIEALEKSIEQLQGMVLNHEHGLYHPIP